MTDKVSIDQRRLPTLGQATARRRGCFTSRTGPGFGGDGGEEARRIGKPYGRLRVRRRCNIVPDEQLSALMRGGDGE